MIASERGLYIINRLNEAGIVDYKSIAAELGVSDATVRRDFEKLEKQGKLRRVLSGAMRPEGEEGRFDVELSSQAKNSVNTAAKRRIAAAAAAVVKPGECIFLDMGTSISPMAPLLLTLPIQIVTPNFELGRRLNAETKAEVFVLGGRLSRADRAALGPMAEENLRLFQFHRAFLGCMGLNISKNTAYETDMECMRLKKIAMENAAESYLLADRSKLSIAGLFCFSALDSFRQVFIDGPRPEETEFPQNFIFAD